jgi:hypothetical protein
MGATILIVDDHTRLRALIIIHVDGLETARRFRDALP